MKDKVKEKIVDLLVNKYFVDKESVSGSSVYDDLELDSLVLLEISVSLEKDFDLTIPDGLVTSEMTIDQSVAKIVESNE
ncbi:TPA: acyl carrier protein [Klebsiella pneumoniae]|uniref:acyl carrier protein n=1 Tax=Klebsiella TaxID=570 RepID=UPI0004E295AF|nr:MULTISPECIES: acyl carrier protein [Klebsiella]KFC37968.1 hypothetical protein FF19_20330 [Klebsiella michiganensis]MCT6795043.1 acyl carrier protein [Klebsiella pneumoniae subsp. pneumoniae]UWX16621.1 acyl carrier protein [Klebsiella pneumoniae]UWX22012.1 acyl carrier protein [Klebsiella pneumoniae]HBQ5629226.1 acyl carrier protein [Klebsiella pneumoniae]